MTQEELRNQFPALAERVYGKPLVYFDNAATSQRPRSVVEMVERMNVRSNANIHRAVHKISGEATELYENGREAVRQFINASSRREVVFTSGTTAAINLVASSFGWKYLKEGDKVVISEAEHHSNIVPWQLACMRTGAQLVTVPVEEDGTLALSRFEKAFDEKVKICAVTHVSNVLGVVNPVKEIVALAHSRGIPVLVDGAQGIVHCNVDVQELDCDFYAFSGHKIFAATGTGILYGKERWLEEMPPYMGGGDMVGTVSFDKTTWADLPLKFEAGTPNFAAAATFAPALELASTLRCDEEIKSHEKRLASRMEEALLRIDGLRMPSLAAKERIPVFSFSIEGVHPEDLALIVDKMGVALRSGLMCAEPLVKKYSENGLLRASLMPYNTEEEIEIFEAALARGVAMLR